VTLEDLAASPRLRALTDVLRADAPAGSGRPAPPGS